MMPEELGNLLGETGDHCTEEKDQLMPEGNIGEIDEVKKAKMANLRVEEGVAGRGEQR
ncbi:hypothetical protein ACP6JB_003574 [Aspergillus fumigatus]